MTMANDKLLALAAELESLTVLRGMETGNTFISALLETNERDAIVTALRAAARPSPSVDREAIIALGKRLTEFSNGIHEACSQGNNFTITVLPNNATDIMTAVCLALLRPAPVEWRGMETRPEIDKQPGRQFILLEGSCHHSGVDWLRQHAGEAWIRKPGVEGEMLQYRREDILRLCKLGDIDPATARVTHWMPGTLPPFPAAKGGVE